jgi:hypothetical protein
MLRFLFSYAHLRLALDALILFVVGLFIAWPVVRYRLTVLARPAEAVLRLVLRAIGPSPPVVRLAGVIWLYNSTVIFIYMTTGWHPILPKIACIWVGMNIGVLMGMVQRQEDIIASLRPSPGQWRPGRRLALLCGALVSLVELPAFWLAIAMGISMGHAVQAGDAGYGAALAARAGAYGTVLVPALLVSALAEAVAIRGVAPEASRG